MENIKAKIKNYAEAMGFLGVGVAEPHLSSHSDNFLNWINRKDYASMSWVLKNQDMRINPFLLMPECQSILVFADSYYHSNLASPPVAIYAQSVDYHLVLKKRLQKMLIYIESLFPSQKIQSKITVDTVPILEKYWAWQAGLGWIGKNTLCIHPKWGSYFFIGTILINIRLPFDKPLKTSCGTCNKCLTSCPTQALYSPHQLNAEKCIAYLTIENRLPLSEVQLDKTTPWVFGCDICQKACPFNKLPISHQRHAEYGIVGDYQLNEIKLQNLLFENNQQSNIKLKNTPLVRARKEQLKSSLLYYQQLSKGNHNDKS